MARRIERLPDVRPPRLDPRLDEWMDGEAWEARRGEDFVASTKGFAGMLRRAAESRGLRVTVRVVDNDTVMWQSIATGRARRGKRRVLDVETLDIIMDQWWSGRSTTDVAGAAGRSASSVSAILRHLRSAGVHTGRRDVDGSWISQPEEPRPDATPELIDRVRAAASADARDRRTHPR